MRITPRTTEDLEREEQTRAESLLLPKGEYDFEIIRAEEKISKSGNPMIEVRLKVFYGETTRFVTDYLMEKMAFKLRHFAESVGMLEEYNAGNLDATALVGCCGVVKVKIEPRKGEFEAKNSVEDYAVRGGSSREQKPVDTLNDGSDEDQNIPF